VARAFWANCLPPTDLRALCIIQGCLNLRVGANLCVPHQQHTTQMGLNRAMTEQRDIDELARRLLLLAALDKRVKSAIDEAKAKLRRMIGPGTTVRPTLSDGGPAGYAAYTVAAIQAMVSDEKAFAAWVQRRYPTECELVVKVRDGFRDKVLEVSEAAGVPLGPGGETAEDAPAGVRVLNTAGTLRAVPDKNRAAELWAEIRAGATLFELEEQDHDTVK
jgi:hypothetical protein